MFLYVWHVRLIYALNYYLLTYLLNSCGAVRSRS